VFDDEADTIYASRPPTEAETVEAWRLHELLRADYPVPLAEKIAARPDVDLHRAVELAAVCPHELAADILL